MRWQPNRKISFSSLILLLWAMALFSLFSCATAPVTEERVGGLAVWDLDDLSPGVGRTNFGGLLSSHVIEVFNSKGKYSVVERTRILRVLEELRLGSLSLVDDSTRLRVGKLIGAQRMVFGGYLIIGDQMRIDLRMVDVESGKVVKAVQKISLSGDLPSWIDAARKAAGEF